MSMRFYGPDNTRIAIIGGGNIGTQFACMFSSKGYDVNLLSSKPYLFDKKLEIIDENECVTEGVFKLVSSNLKEVIAECNLIFVTYPAFMLETLADEMSHYIKKGTVICVVPGTGGAEFAFRKCLQKGCFLAGLQRVPSVARIEEYGKRVRCEGLRNELFVSSVPICDSVYALAELLSTVWGIPCTVMPHYLNVTLVPSNPILHTTRLRTLFEDYYQGLVYERNPLFYGEWTDNSSALLIKCDEELQNMIKIMDKIDLHFVKSLKEHYGDGEHMYTHG